MFSTFICVLIISFCSSRSLHLAELVGGKLNASCMVVFRFSKFEANLQGIIRKVQDAIGSHDNMVLADAQGKAILDSEGTTGD